MLYHDQLLTKEGPLAQVWLAANLEKKLTKAQLLKTSIPESTDAIRESSSIDPSTVQKDHNASQTALEPLALRLTGQLLYGVVRIYSRKAKYLLDDVNEALLRIKTAFRSSNSVTLPAEKTVLSSINAIALRDTVTENELLYQEPLNFDDLLGSQEAPGEEVGNNTSIEIGRGHEVDDLENNPAEATLDLDFDLGDNDQGDNDLDVDQSIEIGRDDDNILAQDSTAIPELTFENIPADNALDEPFDFDMGPLTPFAEEDEVNEASTPQDTDVPEIHQPQTVSPQKRRTSLWEKFQDSDVVRTTKRKIIIDTVTEIPSDVIKKQLKTPPASTDDEEGLTQHEDQLDDATKIRLLLQSSNEGIMKPNLFSTLENEYKRRKLNEEEIEKSIELDVEGELNEPAQQQDDANDFNVDFDEPPQDQDISFGFGDQSGLDFNDQDEPFEGSIPSFQYGSQDENTVNDEEENASTEFNNGVVSESTYKIVSYLKEGLGETMTDSKTMTFSQLVSKDLELDSSSSTNSKRKATRAFFELLVLASSDAVSLKQETLFGELQIEARDELYSRFV
ncbi:BA75_04682T0 [Komagataella pastoris]|uniref:BA75_04682T0 n=1 Tax=Komagataella pastoris TaxID=4922 RepID=A0A1B2JIR4_PICPA|nr:BA75_04682T0 [Komagataella pastoris]